ncbi:MAG: pilus assembly protein PilM [Clostridia bacterium]|nr:pilus assembly protein PilM [Clostridia bacterium]
MQKKQVAVLDVGSSCITAVVGERGLNKTFIIKGQSSFNYEGFADGEFLDVDSIKNAILLAVKFLKKTLRFGFNNIYVGVPGAFTEVMVKDSQISFPKKKRITDQDVNTLFEAAFVLQNSKYTLINRSAIVYELDDYRRVANPVGQTSEVLKGKLSFVLCRNYFLDIVRTALKVGGVNNVEFVSSTLAQAMFLVNAETRDRIAEILDVGYITTTFSLIQGDGILFQKSFDYGGGYITAALTDRLETDFETAEQLKRKVNLSKISNHGLDIIDDDKGRYYSLEEIKSTIKTSLDVLCENVSLAIEESGYSIPEYVPLKVTGGGIALIRGAKEHVSGRLNNVVEILTPSIPLSEKPTSSSVLSLLDLALEQI